MRAQRDDHIPKQRRPSRYQKYIRQVIDTRGPHGEPIFLTDGQDISGCL